MSRLKTDLTALGLPPELANRLGVEKETLAGVGTTQSGAAEIKKEITLGTTSGGATAFVLPDDAELLQVFEFVNTSSTTAKVFPPSGGAINGGSTDASIDVIQNQVVWLRKVSTTAWRGFTDINSSLSDFGVTASAAELNYLDGISQAALDKVVDWTTRVQFFDDFRDAAIDTTNNWTVFAGSDVDATAAAVSLDAEGKVVMGSGDGGGANDGSVMSWKSTTRGFLVSDGPIYFETRLAIDGFSGMRISVGLSDAICTDDEHPLYTITAGTVADAGLTLTNAAAFVLDAGATTADEWQTIAENAGTISNSGAENASGTGPTADTYQVLRIEVDADGTVRFYIDGTLVDTLAVATAAVLLPFFGVDAAGTPAVSDTTIDYVYCEGGRPAADA